ncbi:MAG: adenylate/guanylate cyclase domain-containing protein [Acidobacteria bacterium]|nr:adenylate/guanylate cyclase domain-containing protein [Acidobacteriota bacterium]
MPTEGTEQEQQAQSAVDNPSIASETKDASSPPAARKAGKANRTRRWRHAFLAAGTALASAVLAWILSGTSPFALLELKTYDLRFLLRGKRPPPANILLVTIDRRTEAAIAEPRIFWHPHYATLLRAAAAGGAHAIGLDVSFAISVEPWAPDLDREVAAAFAEVSASVPVVLAYDTLQTASQGLPLYLLANVQGAMGFANFTLDRDDFVRRQELQSRDAAAWESFAARLAAAVWKVDRAILDPQRRTIQFGNRVAPLDPEGFLLVHYWGPDGTFPAVSMADVLAVAQSGDASQLERWFADKVVLIGTLDPSDQRPTPFYLAGGGQKLMSGIEVQANILGTLLEPRYLREVSPGARLALVLSAAVLAAWLGFRVRFPIGLLLLGCAVAIYLGVSVLFQGAGLVLPVVAPVLSAGLSGFASYGAYSLTEGRQRRLLQDVFGRYVSQEVVRELLAYGEIPLGGTRQTVTVMFSDLRDYTRYCQDRDPQQVVEELNEYFGEMTAEIKAHGGMVNKFIGDGIMALFGVPVIHPNDAYRAVQCALRMLARNEEYNRRRSERGLEPLVIGIGLHTGEAVVGTIGAPEKMEYTAIGNTVNVASRIEGENKTFHSRLLLSEATYQCVQQRVVAELAGHARLKGITESVALYKVLELKEGEL